MKKKITGIVRLQRGEAFLEVPNYKLRLKGDPKKFAGLNGVNVTIDGQDSNGAISDIGQIVREKSIPENGTSGHSVDLLVQVIKANESKVGQIAGLMGLRPGLSRADESDGLIIIAITDPGFPTIQVPKEISGMRVERRVATPQQLIEGLLPLSQWESTVIEASMAELKAKIGYKKPPKVLVKLESMEVLKVTCHVGPDSGWPTLKKFLEGTHKSLTVAMYEFYAEHIIETMTELGRNSPAKLDMILQVSSHDRDIEAVLEESWTAARLRFVPASVSGPDRIFNNSYHTKVAVRDSSAVWISSGNWSPNSQPEVDPDADQFLYRKGNREWHVIVESKNLATMYEKFIRYDMDSAEAVVAEETMEVLPDLLIPQSMLFQEAGVAQPNPFSAKTFNDEPVTVMPLMSPDNYAKEIAKLIRSAKKSVYLQFSYIRQPSTELFDDVISAVSEKMAEGLDVRVLVGSAQNPEHSDLLIAKRKWKRKMFKKQSSKVHNKGVIVDGKAAVVGSNNWSNDGTQYNRDTSLVIKSKAIAEYYSSVFEFDWLNLSRPIISTEEIAPVIATTEVTPLGMVRVPWRAWFDE
ncbi:MAG: phospholipase D-like domain-containing protein [Cyclobacteriaceae bacterium]